ncbi:DUF4476 domain-containing protein [Halarcobacter sp.]|uniref:DUF4476 domain-containing protein n=1 Tax=Halarcobacter sp. TaxID=2321133 RepID=UPI0029F4A8FC|nr:DUF4476 domain-containing protein [Halarcobacter sp.]
MYKIDLNEALYKSLKEDYKKHKENKQYQSQLQCGFDYMEALIKLFGTLSISVIKDIDNDLFEELFSKNFKLCPSLGDFKSLTTTPFSKNSKKIINKKELNKIYSFLDKLFYEKVSLELIDMNLLYEGKIKTKTINSTIILLNEYVVSFRNKLKGHGASFKNEDTKQINAILESLDKLLNHLESKYEEILKEIDFYLIEDIKQLKIYHTNSNTTCELLPIVSYVKCEKLSCSLDPKVKLFFYNDGKESKSHYLDYSYNHYYQITSKNEIYENLTKLQEEILQHSSSDIQRQSHLLSHFVGREEELKLAKEHILKSINNRNSSFISIMGEPGIGKSAFLSQLQQIIIEDENLQNEINTYTFFAQKNKMGGNTEEDKYIWNKLSSYFNNHGVSIKQEGEFSLIKNLETLFQAYENDTKTKPLILIIDGLDEFSNPEDIIRKIPLNFNSKIQLIYSSRPYSNIKKIISSILSTCESLNILNQDNLIKEGSSFIIGRLKDDDVKELLSRVLPKKEFPIESDDYIEVTNTIIEKSESVPLYIHYITQLFKEKNISHNENIVYEIKQWAKKLPPKLANFYIQTFKEIKPLSRSILQVVMLSYSNISKEDLYTILKATEPNRFNDLDETSFIENHFNEIEIFLSIDNESKYSFYHLSVKEQLVEYFKDINQAFSFNKEKLDSIMYQAHIDFYSNKIDDILYIKKNSDLYNFLESLSKNINKDNISSYYKDNYFHILNTLVWSNIYISMINHENMKNEKYESIKNHVDLTEENINEVNNFFNLFNKKENKHLFEIRYAYELAFIAKDYKKVLVYKDMYEKFVQDLFLDIALNIDKLDYIQKFVEHKDDWANALNEDIQEIIINIISQQEVLDDSFYDVLLFLEDNHSVQLFSKISIQKALELQENFPEWYKVDALKKIISKTVDEKILDKVLDIAKINIEWGTLQVIPKIVSKIDNIEKALEITNNISDHHYKFEALVNILSKMGDIQKALEIVNNISVEEDKSKALSYIVSKIDDTNKALEIINNISVEEDKSKALSYIVSKIDDTNKALEIINSISVEEDKSKALSYIVSKIDDTDKALEIINSISVEEDKSKALSYIVSKIDDTDKALEIINSISYKVDSITAYSHFLSKINKIDEALELVNDISDRWYKSKVLRNLASKIDDIEKALEIAYSINDKIDKSNALINIGIKANNKNILEKALEFINSIISYERIEFDLITKIVLNTNYKEILEKSIQIVNDATHLRYKFNTLVNIASKTNDIDKAIAIANSISVDEYKSKALINVLSKISDIEKAILIIQIVNKIPSKIYRTPILSHLLLKIKDTEKALELVNSISDKEDRIEFLFDIAIKTNDLEKALEIINSISDESYKIELLEQIISNTEDKKILDKAFKIVNCIINEYSKSRLLINILSKINKIDEALKIFDTIDAYEWDKADVLADILSNTNNNKILKKVPEIINSFTNIYDEWDKPGSVSYIVLQIKDTKKALEIANSIYDENDKIESLLAIAMKTNEIEIALEIASIISSENYKSKIFLSVISKINEMEIALEIVNSISVENYKLEAFINIISRTVDEEILNKVLEKANNITNENYKSKILSYVISKTNDLEKALEIANNISDESYKLEAFKNIISRIIDEKLQNKVLGRLVNYSINLKNYYELKLEIDKKTNLLNYLFYNKLFNQNTNINETIDILSLLSPDDVLDYYNIEFQVENNKDSKLYSLLEKMISNSGDKKIFTTIKEEVRNDDFMLEKFINLYGNELDITKDEYEEEFTYKTFKRNIEYFKESLK